MFRSGWEMFAEDWCAAWNAHDIERVLEHFHDDVVFTSPGAARIVPSSNGRVNGKTALRDYWSKALGQIPDLRFEVLQVFVGIDTVVINYRNQKRIDVCEVLLFEDGRVRFGHGTYPVGVDNPVGARSQSAS